MKNCDSDGYDFKIKLSTKCHNGPNNRGGRWEHTEIMNVPESQRDNDEIITNIHFDPKIDNWYQQHKVDSKAISQIEEDLTLEFRSECQDLVCKTIGKLRDELLQMHDDYKKLCRQQVFEHYEPLLKFINSKQLEAAE